MTVRTVLTIAGCCLFSIFVQLLGSLGGLTWTLLAAAATAALLLLLLRFFEVDLSPRWLYVLLPVLASAAGTGIAFLGSATDMMMWWAPAVSAATAGGWLLIAARNARRCELCSQRLAPSDIAFVCPRCGLLVCEQQCWQFGHQRCRVCEENRVPVFVIDGRWWDRQFGARVKYGRCLVCMKGPEEADLRCCGQCGRPMCRECWDYVNGQCPHCGWIVSGLPDPLRAYMLNPTQTRVSRTRS
jgi:hypothetical protein